MILYHQWCELNINTRHRIANDFGIIKKGSTEVVDNRIKFDGYFVKDIETTLTVEALQKYIGTTETEMALLWTWLIDKAEDRELTKLNIDTTMKSYSEVEGEMIYPVGNLKEAATQMLGKKRGRPKKK